MKPSNFINYPWSSVLNKSEYETVAQNIMKILKRTGDEFRPLSFTEYKTERIKDGNFTDNEENYFNEVIIFCRNADSAICFSKTWANQN